MSAAKELKYLRLFRDAIKFEFEAPTQDFVKYFLSKINYKKLKTEERMCKYTILLKNSLDNYISDRVNNNLRRAMENENVVPEITEQISTVGVVSKEGIITTDTEIECFKIVKAILAVKVSVDMIIYKDTKSYFAINYKNTLQPICRLYFNDEKRKQIGLFNECKSDEKGKKYDVKYDIETLDDIYKYAKKMLDTVDLYDSGTFYKPIITIEELENNKNI